jgi:hypothetical protein
LPFDRPSHPISLVSAERLSITTTCPGRGLGERSERTHPMYASKASRSHLLPREKFPCPPRLCARAKSCSARGRAGRSRVRPPSLRRIGTDRIEREASAPISSVNTSRSGSIRWASVTLQAALSHSSCSAAPTLLFSAPSQAFRRPPDGGVAQALSGDALEEANPLRDGRGGALFRVFVEKLLRFLFYLRGPARPPFRSREPLPAGPSRRSA